MSVDEGPVIVFDGVCLLCSRWVRFLLRQDTGGRYRFAAMQSEAGRALLARHGLAPDDPDSFLLVDSQGAWIDTGAIVRVMAGLGGPWRVASRLVSRVPAGVSDRAYRWVARNRYRWFGRRATCLLPDARDRSRFLD